VEKKIKKLEQRVTRLESFIKVQVIAACESCESCAGRPTSMDDVECISDTGNCVDCFMSIEPPDAADLGEL